MPQDGLLNSQNTQIPSPLASHAQPPELPQIIQGGMGIAVSSWELARAVSQAGQMGVVSGTSLDTVMVRRLADGDPGGHIGRALRHFPEPELAWRIQQKYHRPEGRAAGTPYPTLPIRQNLKPSDLDLLIVLATFVEVWLAREGHSGKVGINLLTKIQTPTLPALYGAMLAGVDVVLMGAGIPREIPEALERLSQGQAAFIRLEGTEFRLEFDPVKAFGRHFPVQKPMFVPIISAHTLAQMLVRSCPGGIHGFIVEGPTAGGHNAPARGKAQDELGQPIYGERDQVDLGVLRGLGLPFWLAGGTGSPAGLQQALSEGARGIQVGTLFAYSQESGLTSGLKKTALQQVQQGTLKVFTDSRLSPTGFPFKSVQLQGTLSDPEVYDQRKRICDLGYLRQAYITPEGKLGFRCAAEPVDLYLSKGGKLEDTVGRKCLCNTLFASVGFPQVRKGGQVEAPLLTAGDDLAHLRPFLDRYGVNYSARDVLNYLLPD
ncbi:nitronate monooxygenase [Deinococcus cellulosilyticus]|uniref:2-nitropropane dioxygenase n=1 Tax=Deinococcus cellulosilyticus (strain DSM 18568 / NBRC 106333 / KACC 11606 / 5516J-15) TaxID=1223518 RepID=A0A511N8V3_DEIC1|nr:nitronate monooxygenase [Deinococcus cellulosilyticus]GEM49283.1 2-nitropropane dioxygenase [Deinococcus cellulosilyticus NBRC 106333 = KACC 11606]